MAIHNFRQFFNSKIESAKPLFFDGGMGTMLQKMQAEDPTLEYELPEELVFSKSALIDSIHREYIASGCDVITANTFGANPLKMHDCTFCSLDTVKTAIKLAKASIENAHIDRPIFVALDIGPTGKLLEPMGDTSFESAYDSYKQVAIASEKAGADLVIVETMSDLYEAKAAILAVKENTSLPVFATMTFQSKLPNGSIATLTGADPLTCVTYLESLGIDAVGFNCGGSLEEARILTEQFVRHASVPVMIQPNAGLPVVEEGKTVFKVNPSEFADSQLECIKLGSAVLGGCCGTTPEHIAKMVEQANGFSDSELLAIKEKVLLLRQENKNAVRVCSGVKTVDLATPVIIGERINPTGKTKCKTALRERNFQYLADEAEAQVLAGAHILDVNAGLPDIDEKEVMVSLVRFLQRNCSVPLQIDSDNPEVLSAVLRIYNGKPLINSVSGKKQSMQDVLPLAKKYGAVVIALALNEKGIPETAEERLEIIKHIIHEGQIHNIPKNNFIADALTLTVSARQNDGLETLKTVRLIKSELGIKTALGVSNVSFGLPRRDILNAHFLTMALSAGLDACIINPLSQYMMDSFYSYRVISTDDKNCLEYMDYYSSSTEKSPLSLVVEEEKQENVKSLAGYILRGHTESAIQLVSKLIETKTPQELIDEGIIPALDEAGSRFEKGKFFLPHLLLCADAASGVFDILKAQLQKNGVSQQQKGRIILATVYGDVHDIGKNIVKAMLENYGYEVLDLGKNVPAELIVKTAIDEDIQLIGLSALMTTTVTHMQQTIEQLRIAEKTSSKKVLVMVGGAVLTESYSKQIGADFYTKDALASVQVAKKVFNN